MPAAGARSTRGQVVLLDLAMPDRLRRREHRGRTARACAGEGRRGALQTWRRTMSVRARCGRRRALQIDTSPAAATTATRQAISSRCGDSSGVATPRAGRERHAARRAAFGETGDPRTRESEPQQTASDRRRRRGPPERTKGASAVPRARSREASKRAAGCRCTRFDAAHGGRPRASMCRYVRGGEQRRIRVSSADRAAMSMSSVRVGPPRSR